MGSIIHPSEPYLKLRQFLLVFDDSLLSRGAWVQRAILLLFFFVSVGWMGAARKGEGVRRRERKKERKENNICSKCSLRGSREGKHFVYSGPKP